MNTHLVRLSLGYFLLAMLWILLGDTLIGHLVKGSDSQAWHMGKGALFVAFTSALLFVLGRQHFRRFDEQQRAQHVQETSLKQAAAVFDSTQEGVLVTDPSQHIVHVNPAFSRITGYSTEEVLGQTPKLFASGKHDAAFYAQMWLALKDHGEWSGEIWNRRKNGEVYPQWQNLRCIHDNQGNLSHYVAVFSDLSALKRSREELDQLAHYDPLVNLPNRLLFTERAKQDLERARASRRSGALLLIDLDHFKDINESLGHSLGDALLQTVSVRLSAELEEGMTLGRLGGDEFALLCEGFGAEKATALALRILDRLNEPFHLGGQELFSSASIGIVLYPYPTDVQNVEQLMRNADSALFKAKSSGRSTYAFYSEELTSQARQRVELVTALRQALEHGQLRLHFQPIYDLHQGTIAGFEALVRWQHPQQGFISPERFVGLAEQHGFVAELDTWVARRACADLVGLLEEGHDLRMAVNCSALNLSNPQMPAVVARILERTGLEPARLTVEVTENALMNSLGAAIRTLDAVRELGVKVSIDDFGSGYSSLTYLRQLPVDTLKVDRAFVREIAEQANDRAITAAIIAMAHKLGLKVVAEGVEEAVQLDYLRANGCDFIQGYYYSRPLPLPALRDWLAERPLTATVTTA